MTRLFRPARPDEARLVVELDLAGFGSEIDESAVAWVMSQEDIADIRVLEEDGQIVGQVQVGHCPEYWGGRSVPARQLSELSVPIERRGHGAGADLVRGFLDEAHDCGSAVSTLFPSALRFYRGQGYGLAGTWNLHEVSSRCLPSRIPEGYVLRRSTVDKLQPLMSRMNQIAPSRDGQVVRDAPWWQRRILAPRPRTGAFVGTSTPSVYLVDGPDGPDGWAVVGTAVEWQAPVAQERLVVDIRDWGARTPAGWRTLLAMCGKWSSQAAVVRWRGPDPEPLQCFMDELDLVRRRQFIWMLRVVDVPAAFASRGFPPDCKGSLALEVTDRVCPWVYGRWLIEVADGQGQASLTTASIWRTASAEGLACLFSGLLDPADLGAIGLVSGLDEGDVAFVRSWHPGAAPWSPDWY